ncbi:MAG: sigma factor-like helix-turn-helix DNA-binding protein [Actinomycetota bacterium]
MRTQPGHEEFETFVKHVEQRLRIALTAVFGQESGRDAAASALAYGWEHWDRISTMENPVGYLYRVGRSSQRRRREPMWAPVPEEHVPLIEPGLPNAIARLSEKQRLAVVLIHAYGWGRGEVAALTGISVSAVDTHLSRGLRKLRHSLGVETNA